MRQKKNNKHQIIFIVQGSSWPSVLLTAAENSLMNVLILLYNQKTALELWTIYIEYISPADIFRLHKETVTMTADVNFLYTY